MLVRELASDDAMWWHSRQWSCTAQIHMILKLILQCGRVERALACVTKLWKPDSQERQNLDAVNKNQGEKKDIPHIFSSWNTFKYVTELFRTLGPEILMPSPIHLRVVVEDRHEKWPQNPLIQSLPPRCLGNSLEAWSPCWRWRWCWRSCCPGNWS